MRSFVMLAGLLTVLLMSPPASCRAEGAAAGPRSPEAGGLMTIEQVIADAHEGVDYLGNEELQQRIQANPKLVLIDVRSREEFDAGHLKGAAWIERGVLEFTLARALRDPDAEIVVYCKKGNRSGLCVRALKRIGYRNVKAHAGFDAWVQAGLPFYNFLGEARMIELRPINSATNPVDLYQPKR